MFAEMCARRTRDGVQYLRPSPLASTARCLLVRLDHFMPVLSASAATLGALDRADSPPMAVSPAEIDRFFLQLET